MKRPVLSTSMSLKAVSILVLTLLPVAAAADGPDVLSREYFSPVLSRHALEAVLWDACPPSGAAECTVYDSRTEGYAVRLVAPPEVQRAALEALVRRERATAVRRLRLDLVAVVPGSADLLAGLLPTAIGALEPLRAQRPDVGFHHLDTAFVETTDEATVNLANGERSFRAKLDIHGHGEDAPVDLVLQYNQPKERDALPGNILVTSLVLPPNQTRLAGTTHYATTAPEVALLITAEP